MEEMRWGLGCLRWRLSCSRGLHFGLVPSCPQSHTMSWAAQNKRFIGSDRVWLLDVRFFLMLLESERGHVERLPAASDI